jgi:hypothetical protein
MPNNDNHIDDLFRRASENYPLKTSEGNWDDVAAALSDKPALKTTAGNTSTGRRYLKTLIPVLILLMTGGAITMYMINREDTVKIDAVAKTGQTIIHEPVSNMEKDHKLKEAIEELNNEKILSQNTGTENQQSPETNYLNYAASVNVKNKNAVTNIYTEIDNVHTPNQLTATAENEMQKNKINIRKWRFETPITKMNDPQKEIAEQNEIKLIDRKPFLSVKQKSFYADMVLGSGYSEVKNQGMTRPGLDAGIRIGYRLNKKFAVESGIIFTQKRYYSSGAFFNMDKVESTMPAGMKVMELNGVSQLYEVPLKVKYDIPLNQRSNVLQVPVSYLI